MKKYLKLMGLIGLLCAVMVMSACGGSGGRADAQYEGKWISVAGEAMGMTLTGDDISGFALELQSGGKAVMTVEGDSQKVKWTNDDSNITIKVGSTEMVGALGEDTIVFDDMLGMGMKLTFAKEGSDAAKPENNLPEADQKMVGTWQSHTVTDVLGDPVEGLNGDELKMVFAPDHTVQVFVDDTDCGTTKWSLLGDDWGSVDDDSVSISWDITEEGIEVNYSDDEDYYIFSCTKQS